MPASFQGTSFLVTYPKTSLDKNTLFDYFLSQEHISYIKLSLEHHEDSSIHYHVLLLFSQKQRFSHQRFDDSGEHPNIKPVGRKTADWNAVTSYLSKEDQSPLEWGVPRHTQCVWGAIASATTREEASALLVAEKPRDAILNARNFDYYLDKVCIFKFAVTCTRNLF